MPESVVVKLPNLRCHGCLDGHLPSVEGCPRQATIKATVQQGELAETGAVTQRANLLLRFTDEDVERTGLDDIEKVSAVALLDQNRVGCNGFCGHRVHAILLHIFGQRPEEKACLVLLKGVHNPLKLSISFLHDRLRP